MKWMGALFLLLYLASGCRATRKVQESPHEASVILSDYSFRKIVRDKELYAATTETISFDSVTISKDTLHLFTSKINGCNAEDFTLLWSGAIMKSLPPQASLKLFHRADPTCKKQNIFHLTFNVSPLRMKQNAVSSNTDSASVGRSTILRVSGWKLPIVYVY